MSLIKEKMGMHKFLSQKKAKEVWEYFLEICKIPRESKHEEKIVEYIKNFAVKHELEHKVDSAGNIIIWKKGTSGLSNLQLLCLQSHIDMVCEKNENIEHDFSTDPIKPRMEGDYIYATGTTLGADNGIGVATQLALLATKDIPHCPIECIFTVDEETGLTGAFVLDGSTVRAKQMINLDNEEDHVICIGCAGGIDTNIELEIKHIDIPQNFKELTLDFTGGLGGHSGAQIHEGLSNSIKLLNRFLYNLNKAFDIYIADFKGGNKRNIIPRDARASIFIANDKVNDVKTMLSEYNKTIKDEFAKVDDNIVININENNNNYDKVLDKESTTKLISFIYNLPHGVYKMSTVIKNLVETSSNLAIIKKDGDTIKITQNQRSSRESGLQDAVNFINNLSSLVSSKSSQSGKYPGWLPNPDSVLLKKTSTIYKQLFKEEPAILAIHAGLECGIINTKVTGMDSISIGPTIEAPHTTKERVSISSVDRFWTLLLELLKAK